MDSLQVASPVPADFADIVEPAPVPWTPDTPAWTVVFVLLALLLLYLGWRAWRHYRANAYRREAAHRLEELAGRATDPTSRDAALLEIPVLMKRTALAAYPRVEVASLSGEAWLGFLDRSGGGKDFVEGPGRLLDTLSSQPSEARTAITGPEVDGLVHALRRWIRRHRA